MNDELEYDVDGDTRGKRRRRTRTARFDFDTLDNEEQKLIQQALKNSQKETKRIEVQVPEGPAFYPTVDEFKDPLAYINKIRPIAEVYGICKIVPPDEWSPSCTVEMNNQKLFATKLQQINKLQEGQGFDEGRNYNINGYKDMADTFYRNWCSSHHSKQHDQEVSLEELSKDYWDIVETGMKEALVEYANDIDSLRYSSGFPPISEQVTKNGGIESVDCHDMFSAAYYARSGWNLNNLPYCNGSVLKYLQTAITGVNVPWLYIGMLFSSFCWHNEDNYLYSINYHHFGAVKQWYGVPGEHAKSFEKVSKNFLLESFRESPDLLHHMTTQISPSLLISNGIPVYKISHSPKTFIVTFPKAFHCGFSYGFNVGEAVNFATHDWLIAGGESEERYRLFARSSVFSHHRLLFTQLFNQGDVTSRQSRIDLATEVLRVLEEEITARLHILSLGVRDISDKVTLPTNEFNSIDKGASDYDDLRTCCVCNHVSIFSAVACECDKVKVACIRHYHLICKCPKDRKYLFSWSDTKVLRATQAEAKRILLTLEKEDVIEGHDTNGVEAKKETYSN